MNSTMEILARISKNSQNNPEEVFTRVYRYMLREDIYFVAYKNLYANSGASTKGIDEDTADGFGEEYIRSIINSLKNGTYSPKPARRVYIPKANGKMRPISVPTFRDKLVQEVMRMILESIYEPIFSTYHTVSDPIKAVILHLNKLNTNSQEYAGLLRVTLKVALTILTTANLWKQ